MIEHVGSWNCIGKSIDVVLLRDYAIAEDMQKDGVFG